MKMTAKTTAKLTALRSFLGNRPILAHTYEAIYKTHNFPTLATLQNHDLVRSESIEYWYCEGEDCEACAISVREIALV